MASYSASETAYNTAASSAGDGVTTTASKWFSLQDNLLNGTYFLMPIAGTAAWWGTTLSNGSGVLSPAPTLTITDTRSVFRIDVYGDSQLNEYPVDFTAALYNGVTLLYTHTVTGNAGVYYSAVLSTVYDVTSIVYTITKVNKPSRSAKLVEASPSFLLVRSDTILVAVSEADLGGIMISSDTALVTLTEESYLQNVYNSMDANERQVFAKVEITYTDPFNDESLILSATNTAYNTSTAQLADNFSVPAYRWFNLQSNTLDGTYYPISDDYSVGWWGTDISDGSGVFSSPPVVTIEFAARIVSNLKLIGDSLLDNYPVDFVFRLYDVANTLLDTHTITGNTLVDWELNITPVPAVAKITATISKISTPSSNAKLTEMFTAIVELYDEETIESIHLLEENGYSSGSLPIGNVSANEIDIVLSNADRRFDLNNTISPIYGYIKRNRRVRMWLGIEVGPEIEWTLMGIFWTTAWDIAGDSLVASLVARDRLELLRLTDFTISTVYVNNTLLQLFTTVLTDAGLVSSEYNLDASLSGIIIPYAWFARMSHREALQRLAACAIIQVYCQKDGVIRVNLDLDATDEVYHIFDDDINVYSSKYPLAVAEQVNYVEVTSTQWVIGTSQNILVSTETISFLSSETIIKTYEFSSSPVTSMSAPVISATVGITVTAYTLYAWGVILTFVNSNPTPGTVTSVSIDGTVLSSTGDRTSIAEDTASIREDGKIKVSVSHDFIQSTTYAESLAANILATYKASRYDVSVNNRGSAALRIGDRVLVNDAYQGVAVAYAVSRQQIEWNGYLQATTEGKKL